MEGSNAHLSTSSPFLEVPPRFFLRFMNFLGGTFDDHLDMYTVECSTVDTLSSVGINLGSWFGLTYYVQPQDYVAKVVRFHAPRWPPLVGAIRHS